MLLPYNVDRPSRQLPCVTYALMGINIFLFLVTVFVSNVNLPADRIVGRQEAAKLLNEHAETDETAKAAIEAAKSLHPEMVKESEVVFPESIEAEGGASSRVNPFSADGQKMLAYLTLKNAAVNLASERAGDDGGYQRMWQIQYMDSSYVLTPHYSALNLFAYRPAEESVGAKLLGLLGSMFLHGDLMHILGNMLFLWVFGRAVEDSLGPRVYLGAYLLCGVAATLLYHIMTQQFAPLEMGLPALGASGAIAGVMGLFAPRFYRTPVCVFYLLPTALVAGVVGFAVLYLIAALVTGDPIAGIGLALAGVVAGLYFFGRTWAWGNFKAPAAWFLGFYVIWFDLRPAVYEMLSPAETGAGGVAHWAHIGGFLFGMLYAFLIGSQKEGKQEFMLEDAEKAYDIGDMAGAISSSQNLLEREPNNPSAYEVMAKAWMKQNDENEALDNFELAVQHYLRIGERQKAAEAYLVALEKYPRFILPAPTQLAVGNQMAKNFDFKNAAETLVKVPYTFPEADEGEVALLRSAQIYIQHLDQPQTGQQLLKHFWERFPESQWMPQVERAWKMAQHQLSIPAEPEPEPEPVHEKPAEPVRTRAQAVAPPLELEPVPPGKAQGAPRRPPGR